MFFKHASPAQPVEGPKGVRVSGVLGCLGWGLPDLNDPVLCGMSEGSQFTLLSTAQTPHCGTTHIANPAWRWSPHPQMGPNKETSTALPLNTTRQFPRLLCPSSKHFGSTLDVFLRVEPGTTWSHRTICPHLGVNCFFFFSKLIVQVFLFILLHGGVQTAAAVENVQTGWFPRPHAEHDRNV